MVTITNGKQQVWKITEDEYNKDKTKWDSRGTVKIEPKKEYDLKTEVEINPPLKVDPEVLVSDKDMEILKGEIKNPKKPNEALKKAKKKKL